MKNNKTARRTSGFKSATLSQRLGQSLTIGRVILGGSLIAALVIIGILGLNALINRPINIEGVERVAVLGGHTENPVNYPRVPPTGGLHFTNWQNCGIYTLPIQNEYAVHSLEHGAVWITYQPELSVEEFMILRAVAEQGSARLLSPVPNLPAPIVVTSWGFQLQLEQASDPRLAQFARQYERNPQYAPEPNGYCVNGVSRMIPG